MEAHGRKAARRFIPHALLLLIAAAELIVGFAARPGYGELRRLAAEGTPRQKVGAFFLLTNRDEPPPFPAAELERILREEPPLLREWTMTSNGSRFGHDHLLRTYIRSVAGTICVNIEGSRTVVSYIDGPGVLQIGIAVRRFPTAFLFGNSFRDVVLSLCVGVGAGYSSGNCRFSGCRVICGGWSRRWCGSGRRRRSLRRGG